MAEETLIGESVQAPEPSEAILGGLGKEPSAGLGRAQWREVAEVFELFDTNKDGFLDFYELRIAAKALGIDRKKAEILELM